MGNKPSAFNLVNIDVSSSIDIIYNTLITNKMSTLSSKIASNTVDILVGPGGQLIGNIDVTQKIDMTSEVSGELSSTVLQNLSSKIESDLTAKADQAANATAGWLSTARPDSRNITSVKQALKQSIEETFIVENYNQIIDNTILVNDATIRILGTQIGNIKIEQGIVARIITKNVINNIINRSNQILNDQSANVRVGQSATSTAKGETISGTSKISSGIISLICCIIIISLLFVALSPAGQKSINKASNTAAARYGGGGASVPIVVK